MAKTKTQQPTKYFQVSIRKARDIIGSKLQKFLDTEEMLSPRFYYIDKDPATKQNALDLIEQGIHKVIPKLLTFGDITDIFSGKEIITISIQQREGGTFFNLANDKNIYLVINRDNILFLCGVYKYKGPLFKWTMYAPTGAIINADGERD